MIVVSNTSPILNLAIINQLEILEKLYHRIFIPEAVSHEISDSLYGKPDETLAKIYPWIETRSISNQSFLKSLLFELHEGEAEAITLALEMKSDLLLIDERHGYEVAFRFDLKSIGLLGILIEAKHNGIISLVKPILDDLLVEAGFWISNSLYDHILQIIEE